MAGKNRFLIEIISDWVSKDLFGLDVKSLPFGGSKFSGDFSDFRDHVMMNTIFLHHGKGGSSLHAALNEGDKKKKN